MLPYIKNISMKCSVGHHIFILGFQGLVLTGESDSPLLPLTKLLEIKKLVNVQRNTVSWSLHVLQLQQTLVRVF